MRYIILAFIILSALVVGVAGFRGDKTRRPPIELIADMDRQPKLRPQAENGFFKDGRSSQLPPSGTVARGSSFQDSALNTGRVPGTTNYVDIMPIPVTSQLMARGQERYSIYCLPCHGAAGDGKGITSKLGMGVIADLHDHKVRKLIAAGDGQIFDTITNGKNLMGGYGGVIDVQDRSYWAISVKNQKTGEVRAANFHLQGTEEETVAVIKRVIKSAPSATH